ncbi:MAG TPA: nitroreductase family protein [bacterium]|nr:nitroreductase family protein [bacterium]
MDLYDAVMKRRSIRKYKSDDVPPDVLERVLDAARWAPSWANVQATRWIVVRDAEIKAKLAEALTPGNPSTKAMTDAPIVLALCHEKRLSGYYKDNQVTTITDFGLFDAGLAAANLTLAAQAEGLGTVHVAAMNLELAADILAVPEDVQLVELIPLGYPAKEGFPTNRRESDQLISYDQYGKKS